jgi:hypothetical protein
MNRNALTGWLALGCGLAMVFAIASGGPAVAQTPAPAASGSSWSPSPDATTAPAAPGAPAPLAPVNSAPLDLSHGREPIHGGGLVPLQWMPPGTNASPVPSDRIFPPQQITIRFNHKKHVKELQQTCKVCHAAAYDSKVSSDRLLPKPALVCDNCHDVNHSNPAAVTTGGERNGQCTFCHLGDRAGEGGKVAPVVIPQPNLRMNHSAHLKRNIQCAQCHGKIEELELATREQLPRMAGCFQCHAKSGPAQGEARGHCTNCHITEPSGRMLTTFSTGELKPPPWLHGAAHTPDWIERHKGVAGANSELCASCHTTTFCNDCHDGRVRPRAVHPSDWISMHPEAARMDNPRCVSCHQLTTFCGDCHRRIGVARDTPSGNRLAGRRFHLAPEVWTQAPRSPQHHSWEAERNLNACVACHTERDCATCHATKGLRGGAGVNPHPPSFASSCATPFKRNPRPCLVCHTADDFRLGTCR